MITERTDPSEGPGSDERYTADYIEREALLIFRHVTKNRKHRFRQLLLNQYTPRDHRILKRWGLK